jgi:hypothetical protein
MPLGLLAVAGIGAIAQSSAASKAAKASKYATDTNAQTIRDTQAANDALYKPYVDRGNQAGNALANFEGLNGTQAQNTAFDNWRNSTGYQFQLGQGQNAITSNKATSGLLNSGATLKALEKYGQGLADTYAGNYTNALQNLSNSGLSAASGNAASNSNAAGLNVANVNNNLNNQTTAISAQTNALTNLLGQATSAYSFGRGMSSYQSGQSGNQGNALWPMSGGGNNNWSMNTNWGLA